jgi:hypothetical protein
MIVMLNRKLFGVLFTTFVLITLAAGVYLVGIKTGFWGRAFGTPANLNVDVGKSFVNPANCWKSLAQGGESKSRMLVSVIPDVKKLQPQYIRIDHIYDNYDVVGRDASGQLTFNWQNLDLTVSDIRAAGATPFFSLSYMPPVISKDGKVDSEPTNWTEWQLVVQRTVEHYSGRRGLNIPNVYYEVWNEPDLFGGFKAGGNKNYLNLYYYAQLGAVSAGNVNFFKIGGPATTALYRSWVDSLLQMAQAGKIRIDFLSWHDYSKSLDQYDNDVKSVSAWLSSYPNYAKMELVISELGINGSNDAAYDGNLSAIHTLATTAALQANITKCFNFEIIDGAGPTKLWGRWGLLTNGNFGAPTPKSRYYAIQFLNNMVGDRMSVGGSGSWVKAFARYDGSKVRVMVVDYDPFGSHREAVPMCLNNLPFKNFTIKRINFLGGATSTQTSATSNSWCAVEGFTPNTAAIFEITPQ